MPRPKVAVVLFNLGGPDRPEAIGPFLLNLFSDPAILRVPFFVRPFLARTITRARLAPATANYALLGGKSPLLDLTRQQAAALVQRDEVVAAAHMGVADIDLRHGAAAGARHHGLALGGIEVDADLLDLLHAARLQQLLGADAVGADLRRVHGDGGAHQAFSVGRLASRQAARPLSPVSHEVGHATASNHGRTGVAGPSGGRQIVSQNSRNRSTRRSGALPAMIAAFSAPIEMPRLARNWSTRDSSNRW